MCVIFHWPLFVDLHLVATKSWGKAEMVGNNSLLGHLKESTVLLLCFVLSLKGMNGLVHLKETMSPGVHRYLQVKVKSTVLFSGFLLSSLV